MITEQDLITTAGTMNLPRPFIIDSDNREVITNVLKYFNHQEGVLDLNKGLMLFGVVGCGKTTLMKVINKFYRIQGGWAFGVKECRKIALFYNDHGDDVFDIYGDMNLKKPFMTAWCFDDLGTENDGKHYGNSLNVMLEILSTRYTYQGCHRYTHITTNCSPEKLLDKYGLRLNDRFAEMFNIVSYPPIATSRR